MSITKTAFVLGIAFMLAVITGCASKDQPSNTVVESEFRHAWYAIHGESGEKGYHWKLQQVEIGGVSSDKNAGTAKASIKFTYEDSGRPVTKTGDFVFRRFGDKWEIEDFRFPFRSW